MRKHLNKHSSGNKVLFFFIASNLVFCLMIFVTIPQTMVYSEELKLLDLQPTGYNLDYILNLFNQLGEEGRDQYLYRQIPVDMLYPLLFGISNSLLMAFFLKKIKRMETRWFYLSYLPIIAAIADYLENIGIITMLGQFPSISSTTASIVSLFSITKSLSTTIFYISLTLLILTFLVHWYKSKKTMTD